MVGELWMFYCGEYTNAKKGLFMPEIVGLTASEERIAKEEAYKKWRWISIANLPLAVISFALAVDYLAQHLNGGSSLDMIVAFSIYTVTNCWFGLSRCCNIKHFVADSCMLTATFVAFGIIIARFISVFV